MLRFLLVGSQGQPQNPWRNSIHGKLGRAWPHLPTIGASAHWWPGDPMWPKPELNSILSRHVTMEINPGFWWFLNIWNMWKHVKTERQHWIESLTMLAFVSRRHGFRDSIKEPSAQPTHLGRSWSSQWKAQHGPTSHTAEHILVLDWEWLGRNQLCGRGKYVICNGLKLVFCWASDIKWPNTMKHDETLPSSTVPPFASKEEGCRDVWATWHIWHIWHI